MKTPSQWVEEITGGDRRDDFTDHEREEFRRLVERIQEDTGGDLRDRFAGQALPALIAKLDDSCLNDESDDPWCDMWVRRAYEVADGMLAERAKPKPDPD